ncbi:MAG: hypothetical protein J6M31_05885 [Bacteroidales bacterium]|nr:hypothetical protein [Bacteroidales bacterium]
MRADSGFIALFYLQFCQKEPLLEDEAGRYSLQYEERETKELVCFVQQALLEIERRGQHVSARKAFPDKVYITHELRIFIGRKELKIRPMAKTVLLLFIKHPEGIVLKEIGRYKPEMLRYYRRVMRSLEPELAEQRVQRILDIFNNDLNVNIARVNAAISALVKENARSFYQIQGSGGHPKSIPLDRSWVQWED